MVTRKAVVYLPYDERREVFCPDCESPGTEWHPAERWGWCHQCGCQWKLYPLAQGTSLIPLGKLPRRTQELVFQIARCCYPGILARVAVLMHRGEPVDHDELADYHRLRHVMPPPR